MSEENQPISNGEPLKEDGRDVVSGRFKKGNKGGPGSPTAKFSRLLRDRANEAFFRVISTDDIIEILHTVMALAKAGNLEAAKTIFAYTKGPPINSELAERIEEVESFIHSHPEMAKEMAMAK